MDSSQHLLSSCQSPLEAGEAVDGIGWRIMSHFIMKILANFSCSYWKAESATVAAIQWQLELLLPPFQQHMNQ